MMYTAPHTTESEGYVYGLSPSSSSAIYFLMDFRGKIEAEKPFTQKGHFEKSDQNYFGWFENQKKNQHFLLQFFTTNNNNYKMFPLLYVAFYR